ncbi:AbrB/MazE/SpoVT family DNA-binding domain-containing protein [Halococcoides cellulosivorans]|uniref:SpoVT-AbrB domain-containing protein n=1 Tax=Halococcoides cellulosivorans TaxID=1679096 RepID=A0A2R4X2F5_9EURY|nr:AbrB/MazE/SpoVT family DNA-binding domain-containing protein [Halococcoides cellulosivorans]AWB27978.1 hypothetical protein HARCEL1_09795 [Halococcoides cellulosivorans]
MGSTSLDDRGRLTLPKELRERYGDRYYAIDIDDGVKLVPVAEDPLAALRDEFADVDKSADELRDGARTAMLDEAGE